MLTANLNLQIWRAIVNSQSESANLALDHKHYYSQLQASNHADFLKLRYNAPMGGKNMKGCSLSRSCGKTVQEFGENTTIHGVPYPLNRSVHSFERFLWVLIVIAFTALAVYWSVESYTQWKENPVLTSIKTTGKFLYQPQYDLLISFPLRN